MGGSCWTAARGKGDVGFKYSMVSSAEYVGPVVIVDSGGRGGGEGGGVEPQVVQGRVDACGVEVGEGRATVVAWGGGDETVVREGVQQGVASGVGGGVACCRV